MILERLAILWKGLKLIGEVALFLGALFVLQFGLLQLAKYLGAHHYVVGFWAFMTALVILVCFLIGSIMEQ